MRRTIIHLFVIILLLMNKPYKSFSQNSKVSDLGEKMFFNIFCHKPDSIVYDFVKKYFPAFTEERSNGGWTMYPTGPIPVYQSTIHSLTFTKHSYFNARFTDGRLDLLSRETKEGKPGITDYHLWFFFDDKTNADTAFITLSSMFDKAGGYKKIINKNGKKVAQYSDTQKMEVMNTVEFILTSDEIHEGKYKFFFRIGAVTYTE